MKKSTLFLSFITFISIIVIVFSFLAVQKVKEQRVEVIKLDKPKIAYERAQELLDGGKNDKAIGIYFIIITKYPETEYAERSLRKLAAFYLKNKDYEKARYYYKRLIKDFPKIKDAEDITNSIEDINMKIMSSRADIAEDNLEYSIQPGDTLSAIAKRFNTTVELIKQINNLKSDLIRVGQKLKIVVARFSIVVDKARNILILKKDGEPFKTYKIATGKDNDTPTGTFEIVDRMVRPPWTKPGGRVIMPDSEEYELGERWMPISIKGYGIHGTNDDSSIGKQSTAGCVRMYNDDVVELYNIVPKGTEVKIVDSLDEYEEYIEDVDDEAQKQIIQNKVSVEEKSEEKDA